MYCSTVVLYYYCAVLAQEVSVILFPVGFNVLRKHCPEAVEVC